ncbi:dihydrodipicolinate synthase family protein [Glaciibacter sp. 2TAF33]|uniref:dihydrodipicolinate synthase family protein n=1 Tax=Glaciibacter sp. 2TAF33 TaxID=3233015 RepID=UPI003F8EFD29
MAQMTAADIRGIYAILATPAIKDGSLLETPDTVDYDETRRSVSALLTQGVDAILTNGTFGEAGSLTDQELFGFVQCVIDTVGGAVPVFAGATTLNTRETIRRGRELIRLGATGLFLGRPMWCAMDDDMIVGFYQDLADSMPGVPFIVYDNPEAFKGKLSTAVYARLAEIPNVVAVKYAGFTTQYLSDLEACRGRITIMLVEGFWYYGHRWAGDLAPAVWSGSANCGVAPLTALKEALESGDDELALAVTTEIRHANKPLFPGGSFEAFATYNVPLEKARFAAAGQTDPGPARPPYDRIPEQYLEGAREAGRRWALLQTKYTNAHTTEGR